MKVCFVLTNAYSLFSKKLDLRYGGAEVQFYFLAKELAKNKDLDVSFVVGDYGQKDLEKSDGVNVYKSIKPEVGDGIVKKIINSFKYFKILKRVNADIYVTTTANSILGVVSLFCRLNNKKHIHRTAHENEVKKFLFYKADLYDWFQKYGIENADEVIVQNEQHKEALQKNRKLNAVVIKNSFNFYSEERDFQKKSILWVARCVDWKNPQLFLNLAQKFPKEKFVIICPQSQGHAKFYEEIKSKANKINNVQFIDFVPFDKIQAYYNEAKIFVNTSDYEGFPNTFIQSCIAETPIVSLNVNPDNFLNKYNCGYCAEGDFDKLAQQTEKLLKDKKDWQEKSKNARKYVKENHDIKKNIERFKKVLEEVKYNR
jgi:glycosyltransferase involved in cell wall biosynthesis